MTKAPVEFQKDRLKTVRGVVSTNNLIVSTEGRTDGQTDKPILIVPFD